MSTLTQQQRDQFWNDGVLTVKDAVTPELLFALRAQFAQWVKESRNQNASYGETVDGRPRFDLEPGHSARTPALRRVNSPADVSDAFFEAMAHSRMTDMVADLIGPNVKHHHNKINSKLPGATTQVKWHQDFCYTPHSNTDLVTALLMLDNVTEDNGPPETAPGSHKGPLYSLWHEDVFTGAVSDAEAEHMQTSAVKCVGEAGSVCLMHTCVAHGSAPNLSRRPRTLFIAVYSAADAMPCCPNPVPGKHQGLIVRGVDPKMIRASPFKVRLPEYPKGASFFVQQAGPNERSTA
ncbi:MAG: phytanoyl-CoA dioxygenase family protein [Arenicellales bacterium]|nr:phytanoyl-CoA dioxygenase family protein [Arenicellales bacterium]